MEDFRTALSEELSELSAPPLTGLVEAATRDGRRVRRRRTVGAAAGSVAALVVTVGLLTGLVGQAGPAPETAAASHPAPAPTALPLDVTPSGRMVHTTSQALLATVVHLMPIPTWKGDFYTVGTDGRLAAMLNVTDTQGTGLVGVAVLPPVPGCVALPDGTCRLESPLPKTRVEEATGPCPHTVVVTVTRPDRQVQVTYGDCRQGESRYYFPPGVSVLSPDQAVALAGDPGFALRSDSALVDAAAERYRDAAPMR